MLLGIDHVVIACADVATAALALEHATGLRATGGGRHERLGTENQLVWMGDSYLELIGVTDPTLAAASWIGAPTLRALEAARLRALEGSEPRSAVDEPGMRSAPDGGVGALATFALATDDLDAELSRLRGHGARLEGPVDGERTRPDGRTVRWRLAIPPRLGPEEPPFLIEHDGASAEWTPGERAARASEAHPAGGPVRLEALELPVAEVPTTQGRYLRATALLFRPSLSGRGARDATVGEHTIRLRPARTVEPPLIRMRLLGRTGERVTADLLGCRFVLESRG